MKFKAIPLCAFIMGMLFFSSCDDEKVIEFSGLPEAAQNFISQFFPDAEVNYIQRDKDDGREKYEVYLKNGTELEFDENGSWTDVDCKFSRSPEGILPERIATHIAENYPQDTPYQVERKLGGYEVSVSGNLELIYAEDGSFVREQTDR